MSTPARKVSGNLVESCSASYLAVFTLPKGHHPIALLAWSIVCFQSSLQSSTQPLVFSRDVHSTVVQRLVRDFKRLQIDPPHGINGSPNSDNIMQWNAVIFGPEDTPWDGGRSRKMCDLGEGAQHIRNA